MCRELENRFGIEPLESYGSERLKNYSFDKGSCFVIVDNCQKFSR
jgi:hypothetical protein